MTRKKLVTYIGGGVAALVIVAGASWFFQGQLEAQPEQATIALKTYVPKSVDLAPAKEADSTDEKEAAAAADESANAERQTSEEGMEETALVTTQTDEVTTLETAIAAENSDSGQESNMKSNVQSNVAPHIAAIVRGRGVDLYLQPDGIVAESLVAGTALNATGRSADGQWLYVETDRSAMGWVAESHVVIFGANELAVHNNDSTTDNAIDNVNDNAIDTTIEMIPMDSAAESAGSDRNTEAADSATTAAVVTDNKVESNKVESKSEAVQIAEIEADLPAVVQSSAREVAAPTTIAAVVRGGGTDLYRWPNGTVAEALAVGTALHATGQSADGSWLYVETDRAEIGWVASSDIVIFGAEGLATLERSSTDNGTSTTMASTTESNAADSNQETVATEHVMRPAPTLREGQVAAEIALTGSRLNVRAGPGTNHSIVAKAYPDERYAAVARTADATWVQIELSATEQTVGWVSAKFVTLDAPLRGLEISAQTALAATDSTQTN